MHRKIPRKFITTDEPLFTPTHNRHLMSDEQVDEEIEQICASVNNAYDSHTSDKSETLSIHLDHENGVVTIPKDITEITITIESFEPYLLTVDTEVEQVEFVDKEQAAKFAVRQYLEE